MEFVFAPPNPSQALKDGAIDFFGGSPYTGLRTFPGWRGGVLLCALSHYTHWFLAVRSDIKCERGDVSAVKGLRLSASADPGLPAPTGPGMESMPSSRASQTATGATACGQTWE